MPKVAPPPDDAGRAEREHRVVVRALIAAAATHDPEIAAHVHGHSQARAEEHRQRLTSRRNEE